jgi:ABC-type uncharacterized transport system permease subunit
MTDEIKQAIREVVAESHMAVSKNVSEIGSEVQKLNGHGRLAKLLRTDLGLLMAVLSFLAMVLSPYFMIKTDIELIRQDVSDMSENLKDVGSDIKQIKVDASFLGERVSKIEGALSAMGITKVRQ